MSMAAIVVPAYFKLHLNLGFESEANR